MYAMVFTHQGPVPLYNFRVAKCLHHLNTDLAKCRRYVIPYLIVYGGRNVCQDRGAAKVVAHLQQVLLQRV